MPQRRAAYPSALKSGAMHLALSTCLFTALTIGAASTLQLLGDPDDAGPVVQVALFDPSPEAGDLALKSRLVDPAVPSLQLSAMVPSQEGLPQDEPSLGVEYRPGRTASVVQPRVNRPQGVETQRRAGPAVAMVPTPRPSPAAAVAPRLDEGSSGEPVGVRINGQTVLPGQAFSAVSGVSSTNAETAATGLEDRVMPLTVEAEGPPSATPFETYARPFENALGQPTVSVVLGGLGLNYTHTRTAIAELPPEVTLAFSPHARGLKTWIRRARDAGHEVLIEVPMEAEEYGRVSPHPLTLTADADSADMMSRLDTYLASATGYFGVMNYEGNRFAGNPSLTNQLAATLQAKGLALVEDGNLDTVNFSQAAARTGLHYAKAGTVIDTRLEADAMRDSLFALEAEARQSGKALGTAIAYPVTIDILREWAASLSDRGIALAPASHAARAEREPAPTSDTGSSFFGGEAASWDVIEAKPFGTR